MTTASLPLALNAPRYCTMFGCGNWLRYLMSRSSASVTKLHRQHEQPPQLMDTQARNTRVVDGNQLELKDEIGIGRDGATRASCTVSQPRWTVHARQRAEGEPPNALFEARHDTARTNGNNHWLGRLSGLLLAA